MEKELYTKYDRLKREPGEEKRRYEEQKKRVDKERAELARRKAQMPHTPSPWARGARSEATTSR